MNQVKKHNRTQIISKITTSTSHSIIDLGLILWNLMTLTSFVFTELANTVKYGGGVLYSLTLFSPSDITALHRMKYGGGGVI